MKIDIKHIDTRNNAGNELENTNVKLLINFQLFLTMLNQITSRLQH